MEPVDYQYIDNDSALLTAIAACASKPAIAVDTEFVRTNTFFPLPALIQLYDGDHVYLVDPLGISDFSPLKALFESPTTVKVMHSCGEDMDVFARLLNCFPKPLFDTQIAASLVGMDYSMSYQRLVDAVLDRQLEKTETRSDWLQRPLTSQQLDYAAHDVLWLLDIHRQISERLTTLGRQDWLDEECHQLLLRAENPPADDEYYLRIKSATRLDARSLHLLRALCIWREREARDQDVPRNRVASDAALVEVARSRPIDKAGLSEVRQLRSANIRNYGRTMLDLLSQAETDSSDSHPQPLVSGDKRVARDTLKRMKSVVSKAAQSLQIPEEILGRKRDLEAYLYAEIRGDSAIGSGWRRVILVEALDRVISEHYSDE